jgi:hypothetical protein
MVKRLEQATRSFEAKWLLVRSAHLANDINTKKTMKNQEPWASDIRNLGLHRMGWRKIRLLICLTCPQNVSAFNGDTLDTFCNFSNFVARKWIASKCFLAFDCLLKVDFCKSHVSHYSRALFVDILIIASDWRLRWLRRQEMIGCLVALCIMLILLKMISVLC